jgi:hypothetical protein
VGFAKERSVAVVKLSFSTGASHYRHHTILLSRPSVILPNMVNQQEPMLKVRNLLSSGGRAGVDRMDGEIVSNSLDSGWIQDSTGRVTDKSQDDPTTFEDDGHGEGFITHTEQDAVPHDRHPVIEFAETVPHYPIAYSCEHVLLLPQDGEELPMTDKRYDFFEPPPETEQLLNTTTVPITLQVMLPDKIEGVSLTSDLLVQNVDAMEWSLLNLVADITGLSKNCNVATQYNHRSLLHPNHRKLRRPRFVVESTTTTISRRLESLPYHTGIYEVATDRESTQWTGNF